jgi:hypothetical protein
MFLAILIFLLSASVSSAYAYWAGTVNAPAQKDDTIAINIGEGGTVTTVLTVNGDGGAAGQVLVPTGQTDNSVDPESVTEKVTVVYTVGWTGVTGATGTLNVATGDVTIDSSETYAGLVNVTITNASTAITTGTDVTVTVEVTLTEPADQDAYTAIAGKAIAISLTFNVEPNNVEPN